jgi:hypothetical protein
VSFYCDFRPADNYRSKSQARAVGAIQARIKSNAVSSETAKKALNFTGDRELYDNYYCEIVVQQWRLHDRTFESTIPLVVSIVWLTHFIETISRKSFLLKRSSNYLNTRGFMPKEGLH